MIKKLLTYQEIDNNLKKIEAELNATDEFKKSRQAKAYLKEAEEMLKKMDRRAAEVNIIIEKTLASYNELKSVLNEHVSHLEKTEDSQELRYLVKKTSQLSKTLEIIDKNIGLLIEEIETILKNFDELKSRVPVAQKQYKINKEKFEEIKSSRESESAELKARLSKIAAEINPQYLSAYLKLRSESVSPPLVPLRGDHQCGGCNMEIPVGVSARLDNDNIIICDNCRRMIYKPK